MTKVKIWITASAIVALTVTAVMVNVLSTGASAEATKLSPQDVQSLDRRLSMIEQRFFLIETRISRVEQQMTVNQRPSQTSQQNNLDSELIRREIETLKAQVGAISCGLATVDERTLSVAARQSERRNNNGAADPCRLNPDAPLRLFTRP
jgi:hypothetical protein